MGSFALRSCRWWALAMMGVVLAGCGASRPSANDASYPASFVAVTPYGLATYSSWTGKRLHWLTHNGRDSYPVTTDGGWVYFARPAASIGATCDASIWRIKTNVTNLGRVTTVRYGLLPFTASANGSVIAWGAGSNCRSGVTSVVIEDLKTGKTHRIEANALRDESNPLALSPNGTLAVVTTTSESDLGQIRLIRHPFRASTIESGTLIPCPVRGTCDANSPSFSANDRLFYIAMTNPHTGSYCNIHSCDKWTYSLVTAAGIRNHILTSQYRTPDPLETASVDQQGTAVIYSLPRGIWRWSHGRTTEVPKPEGTPGPATW